MQRKHFLNNGMLFLDADFSRVDDLILISSIRKEKLSILNVELWKQSDCVYERDLIEC